MKSFLLLTTIGLSILLYQVSILVNVIPQLTSQTRIAELETMLSNEVSKKKRLEERLQKVLTAQRKTDVMTAQSDGVEAEDGGKEQHSKLAAAELPHGRIDARDAVVVTASYIDDCLASRLRQLVESSQSSVTGEHRDVWVIHSHYKFDDRYQDGDNETFAQEFSRQDSLYADEEFPIISNDPKLLHSRKLIASIKGLRSASQSVRGDDYFDLFVGSSKTSFLKLMDQHKYRFGWLVEDDMFYTGQWGALFDALDTNSTQNKDVRRNLVTSTADILSVRHRQMKENEQSWWESDGCWNCFVDTGQGDWPYYSIKKCQKIENTKTGWMMIRVSGEFASSLLRDLDPRRRSANGYHEAIVGAYSKIHDFAIQNIPQEHIGKIEFGGWGKWIELPHNQTSRLENHGPIQHNKLYHPVKCSAYPPGGIEKDLEKWTAGTKRS